MAINRKRLSTIFGFALMSAMTSLAKSETVPEVELPESLWPKFKSELFEQAKQAGVSAEVIKVVENDLQLMPKLVVQDRTQPTRKTQTIESYLQRVITKQRIEMGRDKYSEHYQTVNRIADQFGVEPKYLMALWGVESSYGRLLGRHHVPSALATMAFEGRRREFFTKEFIESLRIIEQGHISSAEMKGSWAGAMGQCQFMPSSFIRYAADGDGDGKRDIWNNTADVLASTANYLKVNGWKSGQHWGRQVWVSDHAELLPHNDQSRALSEWQALGVRRDNGADLPSMNLNARLKISEDKTERVFLVYANYDVILRWNRSDFFATSVGYLADRIGFPAVKPNTSVTVDAKNVGQAEQATENGDAL